MKVFTVVTRNVTDKLKKKHKRNNAYLRTAGLDPYFWVLWWLNWCSGAGCTALGRFFRVGRSCNVLDFYGLMG
jgi:hypothetical protein